MFEKKKTMKCRLILCILLVISIQLVLSHAVKKSTHKMKSYMERVAGKKKKKKCNKKCRKELKRSQKQLDDRNLPNVKTDECGPVGNACYKENDKICGSIVWDKPFYREDCDKLHDDSDMSSYNACERREKDSSDYINIDMLKVNKEGTKTIYEYDCDDDKFSKTELCEDMMKRSSTCKCKSGTKNYEIFGGGGFGEEDDYGYREKHKSVLRLHVNCNNNRMSWSVEAKRCTMSGHDDNCEEDEHRRRRRRRRLLHDGARAC